MVPRFWRLLVSSKERPVLPVRRLAPMLSRPAEPGPRITKLPVMPILMGISSPPRPGRHTLNGLENFWGLLWPAGQSLESSRSEEAVTLYEVLYGPLSQLLYV